ncbi:MAG: response regulator transcription factor [Actinomycetota bacterium]|nr:response regulator transcription factor [Actinomycetota bacterium]
MSAAKRLTAVHMVSPFRVLLVDDQQMLAEALAARLSTTLDIVVVGHCTTRDPHPEVLVSVLRPDVITIEVAQADDAAALLTLFRTAWPPAHLVVLTASRDPERAVEAARAGADGWVSKESSIDTLSHALRCASRGHACFPPEHLGHVLQQLRADIGRAQRREGPLDVLTPREHDVLIGLAQGRNPAEIADELGVSANTVRTHTNKIFTKLGVHSRLEAVTVARTALRGTLNPATDIAAVGTMQEYPARVKP